jgi:hypothetical protein
MVFRTRREARAWAVARKNELRSEAGKPVEEQVTLHEPLRRYVAEVSPTKRGAGKEKFRLREIMGRLPDIPLARVTPEVIQTYLRFDG